MKKILKRYIKRKVFAFAFPFGKTAVEQCVIFITDAPVWQWKKRLWLVKTAIGYGDPSVFNDWLRFLDE